MDQPTATHTSAHQNPYAPLLVIARNAAVMAWERMTHWSAQLSDATVEAKDNPNNLVTVADAQIESIVTGYLNHVRPGDTVVGEEEVEPTPFDPAAWSGLLDIPDHAHVPASEWHIDPIDGTVNFVRGIEHYCFSAGVRLASPDHPAQGTWLAGLVAAPVMNTTWYATSGAGAWVTTGLPDTQRILTPAEVGVARLSGTPAGRRGTVVATGFGYGKERRDRQFRALIDIMERFDDVRRMGSAAIDLCQVAQGRVNAYYERGLGIYDWAGGAVIAREAGCHVHIPTERDMPVVAADTSDVLEFLTSTA
ncbi:MULTISPECIES: inositol monophosphatase family protein [Brevibacterium]|uniref:Inositol-phosphate phosphatase n=1 Tax=Brevibacterium paucivorans TaxID=170994 RepID=A0A2N6VKH8_9MICO|nr:inositol monophosphatase family protein [Brevibacterium paucivorans]MCG7299471.1 inositol-phosphate phosphatase [Brevibacterium sp. ACRRH]PMD04661.1 inositol-phosphate phosphatase [Brevibacterium paucivorans]